MKMIDMGDAICCLVMDYSSLSVRERQAGGCRRCCISGFLESRETRGKIMG
jgi:hypothetical protein